MKCPKVFTSDWSRVIVTQWWVVDKMESLVFASYIVPFTVSRLSTFTSAWLLSARALCMCSTHFYLKLVSAGTLMGGRSEFAWKRFAACTDSHGCTLVLSSNWFSALALCYYDSMLGENKNVCSCWKNTYNIDLVTVLSLVGQFIFVKTYHSS